VKTGGEGHWEITPREAGMSLGRYQELLVGMENAMEKDPE
jgi:hypothetical protein